jgi:hypothetical protein
MRLRLGAGAVTGWVDRYAGFSAPALLPAREQRPNGRLDATSVTSIGECGRPGAVVPHNGPYAKSRTPYRTGPVVKPLLARSSPSLPAVSA